MKDHPRAAAAEIGFRFNGSDYRGRAGDTLAAALIANGVVVVGRSFKYHRPRGIIGSGFAETNALVQLGTGAHTVPNAVATRVPLREGLAASSVNCWPSVGFDLGGLNDRFSRLLSAGFYYKTFIWPSWHLFEPIIRRLAGLGRAPTLPDPDRYAARSHACDVLVIGGGPAGMAAARAAAGGGVQVTLVEADDHVAMEPLPNLRILTRTTASGYHDHNLVTAVEEIDGPVVRQRFWKIRAKRVLIAGGAFERPLLFGCNDRPGVMLAGSILHYLERHGVAAGRRPLFAVVDDQGYDVAIAARRAGLDVVGIVDARPEPGPIAAAADALGIAIYPNHSVTRAIGRKVVSGAELIDQATGQRIRIVCDLIGMSGGWSPAVQLFTQSGGTLRFEDRIGAFVPDRSVQNARSCGAARGIFDHADCIADGAAAGHWAATGEDREVPEIAAAVRAPLHLPPPGAKAFVDMQTDVTVDDLRQATDENYRSVEHVKRYTVWGMGTDQGKLGAVNGVAVLAALQGLAPGALGTTKFRPPFAPVAFGAVAADRLLGPFFHPWKHLPAHHWHVAQNAVFEDYGWLRPSHYPEGDETMAEAAHREALAVRGRVGLFDSSSLGSIEIRGRDAGRFLDLMSVGSPSTIKLGAVRYNLLCNELGTLMDDGVIARLGEDHFLMTASTSHAERVYRWLDEWHQCEWPLALSIAEQTARWAVLTVAGPRARIVLENADCDVDLSREAFPHNQIRSGRIAGVVARIQRVSFTGELSFEIAVAADYAESLATHLMTCGAAEGIIPFGLEALDLLRLEKGYIHIGSDTDSRTQPADIGWGKGIARKAGDFLGKRSLLHPSASAPGRAQLVGLQPVDPAVVLPIGAHIIGGDPHPSRGIVTSSGFSPMLERGLSLALLDGGRALMGSVVTAWSEGRSWPATVADPGVYDPRGERLNG
nr:2Fe-2S iron-sulfur cluster-binding protein [Sphingobium boeckii]